MWNRSNNSDDRQGGRDKNTTTFGLVNNAGSPSTLLSNDYHHHTGNYSNHCRRQHWERTAMIASLSMRISIASSAEPHDLQQNTIKLHHSSCSSTCLVGIQQRLQTSSLACCLPRPGMQSFGPPHAAGEWPWMQGEHKPW